MSSKRNLQVSIRVSGRSLGTAPSKSNHFDPNYVSIRVSGRSLGTQHHGYTHRSLDHWIVSIRVSGRSLGTCPFRARLTAS